MTARDAAADPLTTPPPLERWSRRASWTGLAIIVAVTFITSFDAVSAVAADRGAVAPDLAWAVPLAIDGMIVVGSTIAWVESLRSGRWSWAPLSVVAVAGVLSIVANVAHADTNDVLARALAGVPPAFLIAAVELGAWQIRRDVHRNAREPVQTDIPAARTSVHVQTVHDQDVHDTEPVHEVQPVHDVPKGDITAAMRNWLARNPGHTIDDATQAAIARIARCSASTVSRNWDDAVDALRPSLNGAHT